MLGQRWCLAGKQRDSLLRCQTTHRPPLHTPCTTVQKKQKGDIKFEPKLPASQTEVFEAMGQLANCS